MRHRRCGLGAVARLRNCRVVTVDGRLRRGTQRLGFVVGPNEL
jgi:hypothetical protein